MLVLKVADREWVSWTHNHLVANHKASWGATPYSDWEGCMPGMHPSSAERDTSSQAARESEGGTMRLFGVRLSPTRGTPALLKGQRIYNDLMPKSHGFGRFGGQDMGVRWENYELGDPKLVFFLLESVARRPNLYDVLGWKSDHVCYG
ncbi:hypothetical protein EVAR_70403_1 [Eumeta japonica]|uniref:Uncharacterized protein n=1 Tax=Eumeta variegata TaxID=151549 RepID=A0A4C2AH10_EUMVA|nr:hypothetical protein EVAR_70403_1 [Eumeta japonica]